MADTGSRSAFVSDSGSSTGVVADAGSNTAFAVENSSRSAFAAGSGSSSGFTADTGTSSVFVAAPGTNTSFSAGSGSSSDPVPNSGSSSGSRNGRQSFSMQKMPDDLLNASSVPEEKITVPETQNLQTETVPSRIQLREQEGTTAFPAETLSQKTADSNPVSAEKTTLPGGRFLQRNSAENVVSYKRVPSAENTAAKSGKGQIESLLASQPAEFSERSRKNIPIPLVPTDAFRRQRENVSGTGRTGSQTAQEDFRRHEGRLAEDTGERHALPQLGIAVGALTDCARAQLRYLRKNYELLRSQSEENFFN